MRNQNIVFLIGNTGRLREDSKDGRFLNGQVLASFSRENNIAFKLDV